MKAVTPGAHVIVQARLGSTRLPGKVLEELEGKPMLLRVLERAARIPGVERTILATTGEPEDAVLLERARGWGYPAVAGSTHDVLERYLTAAREHDSQIILRVTADCPLYDASVGGRVLARFLAGEAPGQGDGDPGRGLDYVSNAHPPTYPDGLDTEVVSREALERAGREASLPSEREHVTAYIWNHPERFHLANVEHPTDLSHLRWTVDEPVDLALIREVYRRLAASQSQPSPADTAGLEEVLALFQADPGLGRENATIGRDEGYWRSVEGEATTSGEGDE
ncbi:MAG: glycosyltransferase family protein [Gemmatimonadota bacterium]